MSETHIEVPALLSDKIAAATDEGHFATLVAALGRRIGEIHAEIPDSEVDTSFQILRASIEAGRSEALNRRVAN